MKQRAYALAAACLFAIVLAFTAFARADDNNNGNSNNSNTTQDTGHFYLTPYVWLPTINGNLGYSVPTLLPGGGERTGEFNVQVGPNNYLSKLNFALMAAGEYRRHDWGVLADAIYINISSGNTSAISFDGPLGHERAINTGSTVRMTSFLSTLDIEHVVSSGHAGEIDGFAGVRYFNVSTTLNWDFETALTQIPRSGSVADSAVLFTPLLGLRAKWYAAPKFTVSGYIDAGAVGQTSTLQWFGALGYRVGTTNLVLGSRDLQYDQAQTSFVRFLRLQGPFLGAVFNL